MLVSGARKSVALFCACFSVSVDRIAARRIDRTAAEPHLLVSSETDHWFHGLPGSTSMDEATDGLLVFQGGAANESKIYKYASGEEEPEVLVSSQTHSWFKGKDGLTAVAAAADGHNHGSVFIFQGADDGAAKIYKYTPGDEDDEAVEPPVIVSSKTHRWFKGKACQTDIAAAEDGSLLVFQGSDFGSAKIYKYEPGAAKPKVLASSKGSKWFRGKSCMTSIAAGPRGSVLVWQGGEASRIYLYEPSDASTEVLVSATSQKWFKGLGSGMTSIGTSWDGDLLVYQAKSEPDLIAATIYKFDP